MASPTTAFGTPSLQPAATPLASAPPEWNSEPAWKLPGWAEPVMVASILFLACYITRRKYVTLFGGKADYRSLLDGNDPRSTTPWRDSRRSSTSSEIRSNSPCSTEDDDGFDFVSTVKYPPKRRSCCGTLVLTPNSSRFANNWHSRVLYKFPFLMEMFYWIITYFIYRLSHVLSQYMFSDDIWDVAQENGLRVLNAEQFTILRYLFPIQEIDVQKWFMDGHQELLTALNKTYALIHIPGTVYFIGWYYYSAPTHAIFAVVRRTMTLCNMLAFAIFTLYPCMPPRLLPKEYGFIDTVRHDNAESVWMSGKFVNHLAAMPSMHFGYAFIVGTTCVYHSDALGWMGFGYGGKKGKGISLNMSKWWKMWFCALGVAYPSMILITIVATANHYWLDAFAGFLVAVISFFFNRVFMVFVPLEDLFLWALRIEKPKPNCGYAKA